MRRRTVIITVLAIAAAAAVPVSIALNNDKPATTIVQSAPAAVTPSATASPEPTRDEKAIGYLRDNHGIHFDHPNNVGAKKVDSFLPYTNAWADIEFRGQDADKNFLRPVVKTHGNIKVEVPRGPMKTVTDSSDVPGTTNTYYTWELKITYGDGVTYYMTMVSDGQDEAHSVDGWSAFESSGDKEGELVANAYRRDHFVITATDPAKGRSSGSDGLPVSWMRLSMAGYKQHIPNVPDF